MAIVSYGYNVTNELMHELLKAIHAGICRIEGRLDDLVDRVSSLEQSVAHLHVDNANLSKRMDGIERRLTRIEKRLDLAEV